MRTAKPLALVAGIASLGLLLGACSAPNADAPAAEPAASAEGGVPETPSSPVTLNILDVAGNQKLTGPMVDAFVADHPEIVRAVGGRQGAQALVALEDRLLRFPLAA